MGLIIKKVIEWYYNSGYSVFGKWDDLSEQTKRGIIEIYKIIEPYKITNPKRRV